MTPDRLFVVKARSIFKQEGEDRREYKKGEVISLSHVEEMQYFDQIEPAPAGATVKQP